MGRSSGARPKKADREAYAELKALLSTCHKYEWQKAQAIFDRMTELTGAVGPMGSLMSPRSCKACGYYGHTMQYCPVQYAKEALQAQKENEGFRPLKQEECTPVQWEWICAYRRVEERTKEAVRLGMGCSEGNPPCGCSGCKAWQAFVAPALQAPPSASQSARSGFG